MHKRFLGNHGRRRVQDVLLRMPLTSGNAQIAAALTSAATVKNYAPGTVLMRQDGSDTDLYIILSGKVRVVVNGRQVATQTEGSYVGEMALIDPTQRRSASVIAETQVVAARVGEPEFTRIAQTHSTMWRTIALEVAKRVRERNHLSIQPHAVPHVFIGSASEDIKIAQSVKAALPTNLRASIWTEDVFAASNHTMEDLEKQVSNSDFLTIPTFGGRGQAAE